MTLMSLGDAAGISTENCPEPTSSRPRKGAPLRLVIVADTDDEAQPLARQLREAGFEPDFKRVDSAAALTAALAQHPWDLVLSSWTLDRFSGLDALRLVRQSHQTAPFIIVAGAIGEEAVVAALKAGAQDYVRLDNLPLLEPVVNRALAESAERRIRQRAEAAVLQGEERYRRMVETACEGIVTLDAEARVTYANQRFAEQLGRPVEEIVGGSVFQLIADEAERGEAERRWERCRSGSNEQLELRLRRKGDGVLWALVSISRISNDRDEFSGALAMVTDITQLKQAEEELRETKSLYEALAEKSLAGVYMLEAGGEPLVIYANPRAADIFGCRREELIGRSVMELVCPDDRTIVERNLRLRVEREVESVHYNTRCLRADGEVIDIEVLGTHTEHQGRPVILGTLLDITERKRAEAFARRQQTVLVDLAKQTALTAGDLEPALRCVTEAAAEGLDLERVGVWLYGDGGSLLRNVELFEREPARHSSGAVLTVSEYPAYFAALEHGRCVAVDDAQGDSRTQEFTPGYLTPLGISSMLDAPIRLGGKIVGIVCHESVGPMRRWTPDEEAFSASIADMAALALEAAERREAEAKVDAARRRLLDVEREKKRFTREVLRVVTNGKLQLMEPAEIPIGGELIAEFSLTEPESYSRLRQVLREVAQGAGMPHEAVSGLVLASGEAVTNTLKHAVEGRATLWLDHDRITVRVSDEGSGIHPEQLPATVLQPGFSTKVSLGMGYTLMIGLCDCMWLATGPEGTVVQIAKWISPEKHQQDPVFAILDRFPTTL
ncbi:MAG: PAS domain S-box protein [Actinomycetota bacterium]